MLQFYLSIVETEEDRQFVEYIYTEYKQLMFSTAMSVLHNSALAEDAVHETFFESDEKFIEVPQLFM